MKEYPKKRCIECKLIKPIEDFPIIKKSSGGRSSRCRPCYRKYKSAIDKKWRQGHIEAARKKRMDRYWAHRELESARQKAYRARKRAERDNKK